MGMPRTTMLSSVIGRAPSQRSTSSRPGARLGAVSFAAARSSWPSRRTPTPRHGGSEAVSWVRPAGFPRDRMRRGLPAPRPSYCLIHASRSSDGWSRSTRALCPRNGVPSDSAHRQGRSAEVSPVPRVERPPRCGRGEPAILPDRREGATPDHKASEPPSGRRWRVLYAVESHADLVCLKRRDVRGPTQTVERAKASGWTRWNVGRQSSSHPTILGEGAWPRVRALEVPERERSFPEIPTCVETSTNPGSASRLPTRHCSRR
jgi:hypothetical protein